MNQEHFKLPGQREMSGSLHWRDFGGRSCNLDRHSLGRRGSGDGLKGIFI